MKNFEKFLPFFLHKKNVFRMAKKNISPNVLLCQKMYVLLQPFREKCKNFEG